MSQTTTTHRTVRVRFVRARRLLVRRLFLVEHHPRTHHPGGATIRAIQDKSRCKVVLPTDKSSDKITILGEPEGIKIVHEALKQIQTYGCVFAGKIAAVSQSVSQAAPPSRVGSACAVLSGVSCFFPCFIIFIFFFFSPFVLRALVRCGWLHAFHSSTTSMQGRRAYG
jgi:hypothetical protein